MFYLLCNSIPYGITKETPWTMSCSLLRPHLEIKKNYTSVGRRLLVSNALFKRWRRLAFKVHRQLTTSVLHIWCQLYDKRLRENCMHAWVYAWVFRKRMKLVFRKRMKVTYWIKVDVLKTEKSWLSSKQSIQFFHKPLTIKYALNIVSCLWFLLFNLY